MATLDSDRTEWITALEHILEMLVSTATADHIRLPPLTNIQYRALGERAKADPSARSLFDQYLPDLSVASTELTALLSQHPAIKAELPFDKDHRATFVSMPYKGFRMEFRTLARHLTRAATRVGSTKAATVLDRLLTLSSDARVPGYEITLFRGLTTSDEIEFMPGLEVVPYERAAKRGLVTNEAPAPWNDSPDYHGMGALVLAREMTWGPCLVDPARTERPDTRPTPTFRSSADLNIGLVFDLLSIVTSHQIQVMFLLCCAPEFVDINPNFGPGSGSGYINTEQWSQQELTPEHVDQMRELLCAWHRFAPNKRDAVELAISRLASSIQRERGRFRLQDRILGAAIALEVMYELESSEIRYKLATRAGCLLTDDPDERLDIFKQMTSFYDARSTIAHGDRRKSRQNRRKPDGDPRTIADSGFVLACKTLRKLFELGDFPDWNKLVMS